MAFKKPAVYQQAAVGQPTQLEHDVQEALANLLGHHNVGQWASDHSQEGKSFQGWNYLAIAAIGRQAARAHGYVYSAAPQAVAKRKAAMQTWGSLWKSMAQDGSADAVGDDNWVARMVDKPNRTQSGALFRWEFIQQMHLHGACIIWNRRSIDCSRTAARYIIPIALTEPVYQNQYQTAPNGGVKIHHYEAGLGFLTDIGVSTLASQAYRFPISTGSDAIKVVASDVTVAADAPYTQISVRYFDQAFSRDVDKRGDQADRRRGRRRGWLGRRQRRTAGRVHRRRQPTRLLFQARVACLPRRINWVQEMTASEGTAPLTTKGYVGGAVK